MNKNTAVATRPMNPGRDENPSTRTVLGDGPSAEDQHIERLVEQQLRAIQQRHSIDRNFNRGDLGIGR